MKPEARPAVRERAAGPWLPAQVAAHAKASAGFAAPCRTWTAAVTSREALARLPVIRKSELLELQKPRAALRRFRGHRLGQPARAPGVRLARADLRTGGRAQGLLAPGAGFPRGGLPGRRPGACQHLFVPLHAGRLDDGDGAHALGCTVFPAGVGQTEQQVAAMLDLRPDAYAGTPSFLRILLDKADERACASTA